MDDLPESGASMHRRRRRRRAAITLSLVGLLMIGTFTYAAAYFSGMVGNRGPRSVATRTCAPVTVTVPAKAALAPSAVTINVYNATIRGGLAASVAKTLRTQGFKVARVANDPLVRTITGVGEIRHGAKGTASASLAAARLSGARIVRDKRTDSTVDLVLGNAFRALSTPPKIAAQKPVRGSTSVKVSRPALTPSATC